MVVAMALPFAARAQQQDQPIDFGVGSVGQAVALPEGNPIQIVMRLVNVALEFIAILMLVMVLWSGFQFLFSGGKQENMAKAGATLKSAIIGLIIILCSWAIVQFVISSFVGAINGTPAGG